MSNTHASIAGIQEMDPGLDGSRLLESTELQELCEGNPCALADEVADEVERHLCGDGAKTSAKLLDAIQARTEHHEIIEHKADALGEPVSLDNGDIES